MMKNINSQKILKIELENYRNHQKIVIDFKNQNNIFGANAVGKTNIIEAIELIGNGKNLHIKKEKNLIKKDFEYYKINAIIKNNDKIQKIIITNNLKNQKKIMIDEQKIGKISEYINYFKIVNFTPNDLFLIKQDQVKKRKYFDILIAKIEPNHLINLQKYNKLIKQKNKTLKQIKYYQTPKLTNYLKIINTHLIEIGKEISEQRQKVIKAINDLFEVYFQPFNEKFTIEYKTDFNTDKKELITKINENLKLEITRGYAIYGIQRDKYEFKIDENVLDVFGSQGQKRTFIILLKKIEIDLIEKNLMIKPIVILDDLLNEFDQNRQIKIINLFKENQIIVTSNQNNPKIENNIELKENNG